MFNSENGESNQSTHHFNRIILILDVMAAIITFTYCLTPQAMNNGKMCICMNRAVVTWLINSRYGSIGSKLQREGFSSLVNENETHKPKNNLQSLNEKYLWDFPLQAAVHRRLQHFDIIWITIFTIFMFTMFWLAKSAIKNVKSTVNIPRTITKNAAIMAECRTVHAL